MRVAAGRAQQGGGADARVSLARGGVRVRLAPRILLRDRLRRLPPQVPLHPQEGVGGAAEGRHQRCVCVCVCVCLPLVSV